MLIDVIGEDLDDTAKVAETIVTEKPSPNTLRECLWAACRRGKLASAKILIEQGADVLYANSYGKTMLMVSSYKGFASDHERLKLIQLLIQHGADPRAQDFDDKTPLHYAAEFDRPSIVVWLSDMFEPDTISEVFLCVVQQNNISMARTMLTCGADINYSGSNGIRPVVIATCIESCEMLSLLLRYGSNINAKLRTGATAIHFAARKKTEILAMVLENGADVSASTNAGNTALHNAADENNFGNVLLLLRHGAKVNATNENSQTPLLIACRKKNIELNLVRTLLKEGADPNLYDESCTFPVHMAVIHMSFELLDLLLAYGADINPSQGAHPLPLLCSRNGKVSYNLVQGLIVRGALLKAAAWFNFITYDPTLLKLGVWALGNKRAAIAYFFTFVYGEEKGIRPVPVPRRLTGAAGLYPIRKRLAAYLVHGKSSVRYMIQEISQQF
jgi:ankyrin repeat protein